MLRRRRQRTAAIIVLSFSQLICSAMPGINPPPTLSALEVAKQDQGGEAESACQIVTQPPIRRGSGGDQPAHQRESHCGVHNPEIVNGSCSCGDIRPVCFADCLEGAMKWDNWTSYDDGIRVTLARPQNLTVAASRCMTLTIETQYRLQGYLRGYGWTGETAGTGEYAPSQKFIDSFDEIPSFGLDGHCKETPPHPFFRVGVNGTDGKNRTSFNTTIDLMKAVMFEQWLVLKPFDFKEDFDNLKPNWTEAMNMSKMSFRLERNLECERAHDVNTKGIWLVFKLDSAALAVALALVTVSQLLQLCYRRLVTDRRDSMLVDPLAIPGNFGRDDRSPSVAQLSLLRKNGNKAWRDLFVSQHPLSWPYYVWLEPEETFIVCAGVRAVNYLRFQAMVVKLLLVMNAMGLVVMVVNMTGHCCDADSSESSACSQQSVQPGVEYDYMCHISSQNVEGGSFDPRLYVHLCVTICFSVLTFLGTSGLQSQQQAESPGRKSSQDFRLRSLWGRHTSRPTGGGGGDGGGGLGKPNASLSLGSTSSGYQYSSSGLPKAGAPPASPSSAGAAGAARNIYDEYGPEDLALSGRVQGGGDNTSGGDGGGGGAVGLLLQQEPQEEAAAGEPQAEPAAGAELEPEPEGQPPSPGMQSLAAFSPASMVELENGRASSRATGVRPASQHSVMIRHIFSRIGPIFAGGAGGGSGDGGGGGSAADDEARGVQKITDALRKFFNRPPNWFVVDVYLHYSARRSHCTAFITFDTHTAPAEIIASHRRSFRNCGSLRQILAVFGFVLCPCTLCGRRRSSNEKVVDFGYSPEARALGVAGASPGTETKNSTLVGMSWCPDFEFRGT